MVKTVPLDGTPFQPYYTVHDIFWVVVFLPLYGAMVFFAPEGGGYLLEYNNFNPADPLKTPLHIAPVWYFTPFYSMLRATTEVMVNDLAGGALVRLLPDWQGQHYPLNAILPSNRFVPARVRVLVDFLADKLAALPSASGLKR